MQALLVRKSAQLLKKALSQTDERSKLEGEVVGGMDVVKCCTWEVGPPARQLRRSGPKGGSGPGLNPSVAPAEGCVKLRHQARHTAGGRARWQQCGRTQAAAGPAVTTDGIAGSIDTVASSSIAKPEP